MARQKRISDPNFWLKAINATLAYIQANYSDDSGIGVFHLSEVLSKVEVDGVNLGTRSSTMGNHLHFTGALLKMDKQANGKFAWQLKKTRVTARDMDKSRAKLSAHNKRNKGVLPKKATAKKPDSTKATDSVDASTADNSVANDGYPNLPNLASEVQERLDKIHMAVLAMRREIQTDEESLSVKRAHLTDLENEFERISEAVRNATAGLMQAGT